MNFRKDKEVYTKYTFLLRVSVSVYLILILVVLMHSVNVLFNDALKTF